MELRCKGDWERVTRIGKVFCSRWEKFFTDGGIIKSIRFNLNIHYAGKAFSPDRKSRI